MRKLFLTVFYSGLSPKAPGTVGSFVSLLLIIGLVQVVPVETLFLLTILISVIAVKQIDIYEKEIGEHDSKEIVVDELAGMWLAFLIAGTMIDDIVLVSVLTFLFFRAFDIYKPSVIGKIDRDVAGGWGVMGDDLVAGFFAGISACLVNYIIFV